MASSNDTDDDNFLRALFGEDDLRGTHTHTLTHAFSVSDSMPALSMSQLQQHGPLSRAAFVMPSTSSSSIAAAPAQRAASQTTTLDEKRLANPSPLTGMHTASAAAASSSHVCVGTHGTQTSASAGVGTSGSASSARGTGAGRPGRARAEPQVTVDQNASARPHAAPAFSSAAPATVAHSVATNTRREVRWAQDTSVDRDQSTRAANDRPSSCDGRRPSPEGLALADVLDAAETRIFNFTHLNALQSRVFDAVYHSSRNIVVAAPTGSGKTVVMELAILRHAALARAAGAARKVVYVCPLVALCHERDADWSGRLASLGLHVCCCVGSEGDAGDPGEAETESARVNDADLLAAHVLITTPEKLDSLTRRSELGTRLLESIGLLLLDEVHTVGDDRGATLEAVVARMLLVDKAKHAAAEESAHRERLPGARLRVVALSATLPNASDIGRWLGTWREGTFMFDESFRPVPLQTHVVAIESKADGFLFERSLDGRIFDIVSEYSGRRPALIFCASRAGSIRTAERVCKDAMARTPPGKPPCLFISPDAAERCRAAAARCSDVRLKECLTCGVGFHNAGAGATDRRVVEQLFLSGDLPVLCTTSTLAMGVNLPAHLVVVKSTQAWRGSGEGYVEYQKSMILQMLGRAGRPQFDTTGVAVILTQERTRARYESITTGADFVDSVLLTAISEHLCAEICLGNVVDVSTALAWLQTTFLFVRMQSAPSKYGLAADASAADVLGRLQSLVVSQFCALLNAGLMRIKPTVNDTGASLFTTQVRWTEEVLQRELAVAGVRVEATAVAGIMLRHYLKFGTMALMPRFRPEDTLLEVITSLCAAPEVVQNLIVRRDEKKALREVKTRLGRFRTKVSAGKVSTPADKALQLLQIAVGRIGDIPGCSGSIAFSLRTEGEHVVNTVQRIARALVQYCECPEVRSALLPIALQLHRSLDSLMWPDANPLRGLLQLGINGMTARTADDLYAGGFTSFASLHDADAKPWRIEQLAGKPAPFGTLLLAAARSCAPLLSIRLESETASLSTTGRFRVAVVLDSPPAAMQAAAASGARSAPKGQAPITLYMTDKEPSDGRSRGTGPEPEHGLRHAAAAVSAATDACTQKFAAPRHAKHSYTLIVCAAAPKAQLLWIRRGIATTGVHDIRVADECRASPLQVHLLHASLPGLDTSIMLQPQAAAHDDPRTKAKAMTGAAAASKAASRKSAPRADAEAEAHTSLTPGQGEEQQTNGNLFSGVADDTEEVIDLTYKASGRQPDDARAKTTATTAGNGLAQRMVTPQRRPLVAEALAQYAYKPAADSALDKRAQACSEVEWLGARAIGESPFGATISRGVTISMEPQRHTEAAVASNIANDTARGGDAPPVSAAERGFKRLGARPTGMSASGDMPDTPPLRGLDVFGLMPDAPAPIVGAAPSTEVVAASPTEPQGTEAEPHIAHVQQHPGSSTTSTTPPRAMAGQKRLREDSMVSSAPRVSGPSGSHGETSLLRPGTQAHSNTANPSGRLVRLRTAQPASRPGVASSHRTPERASPVLGEATSWDSGLWPSASRETLPGGQAPMGSAERTTPRRLRFQEESPSGPPAAAHTLASMQAFPDSAASKQHSFPVSGPSGNSYGRPAIGSMFDRTYQHVAPGPQPPWPQPTARAFCASTIPAATMVPKASDVWSAHGYSHYGPHAGHMHVSASMASSLRPQHPSAAAMQTRSTVFVSPGLQGTPSALHDADSQVFWQSTTAARAPLRSTSIAEPPIAHTFTRIAGPPGAPFTGAIGGPRAVAAGHWHAAALTGASAVLDGGWTHDVPAPVRGATHVAFTPPPSGPSGW